MSGSFAMRPAILAALLLGLPAPASAAQPPAAQPPRPRAPAAEVPDSARLAAARRLVDLIAPPGTMREIMPDVVPDRDTLLAQFATRLGIDTEGMSPEERVRAVEARVLPSDRHFRERLRITLDVTRRIISEALEEMEPELRRVMVTLMARQFDPAELGELEAFMTTPTGGKYARLALNMTRDPAWREMMTVMIPRLAAATGARAEAEIRAATAHLDAPPPI